MNKIIHQKVYAPHNYKSGELFLGKYRIIDVAIMATAIVLFITVLLLSMFVIEFNLCFIGIAGVLIPVIMVFLVQPLNGYHNYLEYFRLLILYKLKPKHFSGLVQGFSAPKKIKMNRKTKNVSKRK